MPKYLLLKVTQQDDAKYWPNEIILFGTMGQDDANRGIIIVSR